MATLVGTDQASLLDDRINILDRNAADATPIQQVFSAVSGILVLVRDKMVANEDSVQLSDYCFDVCEVLKAAIQGRSTGSLSEATKTALEDLGRIMWKIEQVLAGRAEANMPHAEYDKDEIEGYKMEIQQILHTLDAPSPSLSKEDSVDEPACTESSLVDSATTSVSQNALERLISRQFVPDELPSLVEGVLTCKDVDDATRRLPRDGAQAFIDAVDQALNGPDLSLRAQVKCLRRLYRTCGSHGLLPEALKVSVCYDHTVYPMYSGGYADVWKGEYCGQDVAVKVIRTYSKGNVQKMISGYCKEVITWKSLQHRNVLPLIGVTMSGDRFAMVSEWMVNGNINEFVKENPDANRLGLLEDVARGLVYIHSRGMIHGDLKGANILIDQTGHACLADFGLLSVLSDPATLLPQSSYAFGGTLRWTSPELIAPEEFGFKTSRSTRSSDCYALGMVIYETISGKLPFHDTSDRAVFLKVVKGERPRHEAGFTDSLWKMVEKCWESRPNDRPSVQGVLQCLKDINKESDASMCHDCQSVTTPVLGRGPEGQPLCNACDLYHKKHGVARSSSPKSGIIDGRYVTNHLETKHGELEKTGERPDYPTSEPSHPQPGSSKLPPTLPKALAPSSPRGHGPTTSSGFPDPPSGPFSLTTTTSIAQDLFEGYGHSTSETAQSAQLQLASADTKNSHDDYFEDLFMKNRRSTPSYDGMNPRTETSGTALLDAYSSPPQEAITSSDPTLEDTPRARVLSAPVDESCPPIRDLLPPPEQPPPLTGSMGPPDFIPGRPPSRPLSPPPAELIRRATRGSSIRSSLSSDHRVSIDTPNFQHQRVGSIGEPNGGEVTDSYIIHAISQTMIGEFLYKYPRKAIGKGYTERRHRRFFWVHPYTKTLYWSSTDPGSSSVSDSSAKSACIDGVRSVLDPNPMPPGLCPFSVIVSTPTGELKFTAPTKERHDVWLNALRYLLARPGADGGIPPSPMSTGSDLADERNHSDTNPSDVSRPFYPGADGGIPPSSMSTGSNLADERNHSDANPRDISRPFYPAWSFRSRAGTTHPNKATSFFSKFGSLRGAKSSTKEEVEEMKHVHLP